MRVQKTIRKDIKDYMIEIHKQNATVTDPLTNDHLDITEQCANITIADASAADSDAIETLTKTLSMELPSKSPGWVCLGGVWIRCTLVAEKVVALNAELQALTAVGTWLALRILRLAC